jgi:hypothetical protein
MVMPMPSNHVEVLGEQPQRASHFELHINSSRHDIDAFTMAYLRSEAMSHTVLPWSWQYDAKRTQITRTAAALHV